MEDAERLRHRLMEVRIGSGLTYAAFADELGISKSSISRYENGELPVPKKIGLALDALAARNGGRAHG